MMLGRRMQQRQRKYVHNAAQPAVNDFDSTLDLLKEVAKIPLPNEADDVPDPIDQRKKYSPSFLTSLKDNIIIDDIILVGLIFLLIHEGLDDDVFIIILLYLLLFGKNR